MKHRPVTGDGFKDYYLNQIGHGMPVFAGATMQRGHGLGNMLRGLIKAGIPLIHYAAKSALKRAKPIIKEVGKRALKRGAEIAVTEMINPKRSKMTQFIGATVKDITKKAPAKGRGRKRKNQQNDIFTL